MIKTIKDFELDNKIVIIRCDLNVPIVNGKILDDNRIRESLKTITYAMDNNAKVILMSHMGRIKEESDKALNTLLPVAKRLSELIGKNVIFVNETRGTVLEEKVRNMKPGDVLLMENTRYEDFPDKKESSNDESLSKYWASLGDLFINDAFGTAHRSHASNVGIAAFLPSGIGFLMEKEIKALSGVLNTPEKPYVVIMGGAKMNDKIKVIDKLALKADYLLLAGGIANTFLVANNVDMKKSKYDKDSICFVKELMKKYPDKIILPVDGYGSTSYEDELEVFYEDINNIKDDIMILDIGPKTVELFSKYIKNSKTIFWNGPVGVSEFKNFEYGTKEICKLLKESSAKVIIGGGDSAAAAIRFGYKNEFYHISTGGGASLKFMEGEELPGLKVLEEK